MIEEKAKRNRSPTPGESEDIPRLNSGRVFCDFAAVRRPKMSQFYTVREATAGDDDDDDGVDGVSVNEKVSLVLSSGRARENHHEIVTDGEGGTVVVSSSAAASSSSPDALHLMSSTLPTSNLFVNYPHTMWERDSEGNRVPVVKANSDVVSPTDILGQAAAAIKTEPGTSTGGPTTVTTITLPQNPQVVVSPTQSQQQTVTQRIVVTKAADGLRPHSCEVCTKTFAKREHLTKHLRIHKSDNKRYSCEYCQKAFRDRYELVRHTRRHTGDFPFRCQDCNKGFMRHERYMTHLRWHSGERPYQCTMCEKSFRDRSELNRHSRRHTGDLPYKCETCGKGFLRRERYVTHVRIHTGEKPFVCAVCSRGYRDRRELKKHQTSHNHSGLSAPIPGTGPVPLPPPNAASSNLQTVTKTIIVQQPIQQQANTVNLPSTPVPKELLNINGQTTQVVQQVQPLNPANIPLPPSVASALQSINEKVTARQNKQKMQAATVIPKQEPIITLQGSPTGGSGSGSSSSNSGPLFYYLMPGSVPYSLTSEGGATVQVKTSEGNIATAQLVTVPSSAIQSMIHGSGSGSGSSGAGGGGGTSWILEATSPSAAGSRNSM